MHVLWVNKENCMSIYAYAGDAERYLMTGISSKVFGQNLGTIMWRAPLHSICTSNLQPSSQPSNINSDLDEDM